MGLPSLPSAEVTGPYLSLRNTFDADSGGMITKIYTGSATLSSGVKTVTLPNGEAFSNTNYKVFLQMYGSLIATADSLEVISASTTASSFLVNTTTTTSSMAGATFFWMAIGN